MKTTLNNVTTVKNIETLGQVFTRKHTVAEMLNLRKNQGTVMEPSCGNGAFSEELPKCTAIEIDPQHAPANAIIADFFEYSTTNKFDTIIGNPPYVRFRDILNTTLKHIKKLGYKEEFDERTNLYVFFIRKCLEHLNPNGEIIFITPRDFLNATSSQKLNKLLYNLGTITDLIDLGDSRIFDDATPNCIIWRFEKDNFSRKTNTIKRFIFNQGCLIFTEKDYPIKFSDIFEVKVGGVSGNDTIFRSPKGNLEFITSKTVDTGETTRMFYNTKDTELLPHKEKLLQRRIKEFNESNWYTWGRGFFQSEAPRIYVNCKTRKKEPFYTHTCKNYDGSVLAIFPKIDKAPINQMVKALNNINWEEMGLKCGGRFLFAQRTLTVTMLPEEFSKWQPTTSPTQT